MTITTANARNHLRIDGTDQDIEVALYLDMARAMIEAYLGEPRQPDYNELTAEDGSTYQTPTSEVARRQQYAAAIDVCTLLALGEVWANREASGSNPLPAQVQNILNLFRQPSYA